MDRLSRLPLWPVLLPLLLMHVSCTHGRQPERDTEGSPIKPEPADSTAPRSA